MDNLGQGLVDDLVTRLADLEGQVGVLVIGRLVVAVKTAKVLEEGAWYHHAGARAVIDLACEVVLGVVGIVELAVIRTAGIAPDHATGLLQPAVGIEQLGTSESRAGDVIKGASQGLEPAGRDDRVVVEKNEELAPGACCSPVAGPDKAEVLIVSRIDDPLDPLHHLGSLVGRRVIAHDDLVGWSIRELHDGPETGKSIAPVVKDGDDDRDIHPIVNREDRGARERSFSRAERAHQPSTYDLVRAEDQIEGAASTDQGHLDLVRHVPPAAQPG